jgi:hypothetical protein
MLPIVVFMVIYKSLWLIVVAYPLWSSNQLAGSSAEGMARIFRWVAVAIVGMPWKYFFEKYVLGRTPQRAASSSPSPKTSSTPITPSIDSSDTDSPAVA